MVLEGKDVIFDLEDLNLIMNALYEAGYQWQKVVEDRENYLIPGEHVDLREASKKSFELYFQLLPYVKEPI